jgi:hypothetical protein
VALLQQKNDFSQDVCAFRGRGEDLKYRDAVRLENLNVKVFGWIDFTYFDMELIKFRTS